MFNQIQLKMSIYNKTINVFISHSSDDKVLVRSVICILGRNGIVVDEYIFEDGERTLEEINKSIEKSNIFCLLISRSSMNKEWVHKEIAKFKSIIDNGDDSKFLPLIIDESINYSYEKIPKWIKDTYNIRNTYSHPVFIARKIDEEINILRWRQYPQIKQRECIFAGREYDMAKLKEKYYSGNLHIHKALVVSGIPDGIGRRRLLIEFIKNINTNKKETYTPLSIALDKGTSIEDFIIQLNSLLLIEGNESIVSFVSTASREDKINKAIQFVNLLCDKKEELLIRDNGAIILSNGSISDWFEAILTSSKINQTIFYIASRNRFLEHYEYSEIVSYALEPLTEKSSMLLMRILLQNQGKSIDDEDIKYFLSKTANMPQLIFNCVDRIVELGPILAKKKQKSYEYKGDELIKSLVEDYKDNKPYLQTLILLSEVDFLTYQQIERICKGIIDNVYDILMEFFTLSIYEHVGSNNEYIRMNPIISDLIKRSRYRLNPEIWSRLQEQTNEIIEQQDFETADLGILTKKIENEIKGDIRNINRKHIVPSIALRIISDEYGKKRKNDYENVIHLCKIILDNSNNLYHDIIQRIYYYLCASYAQLGEKDFFDYYDELSEYEKAFLHGIYLRKKKEYSKAEKKFKEALNIFPESYTAKNELAISLQRQGKYTDALKMASDAYHAQPNNAFYIVTYFKSLVRDQSTEDNLLKKLIEKLKSSWDTNRQIFALMLEAEYAYYRDGDFDKSMGIFKKALSINPYYPIYISASEICHKENKYEYIQKIKEEFHLD